MKATQRSPGSASSAWAREKRFADVLGRRMAYVERGAGHPIVFLKLADVRDHAVASVKADTDRCEEG